MKISQFRTKSFSVITAFLFLLMFFQVNIVSALELKQYWEEPRGSYYNLRYILPNGETVIPVYGEPIHIEGVESVVVVTPDEILGELSGRQSAEKQIKLSFRKIDNFKKETLALMALAAPQKRKIAIIGAGIIGKGMAINFLKNGYQVTVWNRSSDKLESLIAAGATVAQSPKEAAEQAEVIFETTANNESSQAVWYGADGILAGATSQSILIASSTLSVGWIDELVQECSKRSLNFMDIPVTGGRAGAEEGSLTMLAGGNKNLLNEITAALSAISKEVHYFGKAGSGMRYKLLLNRLQAIHIAAFGEVMNLAEKHGLDIDVVGNALAQHPGGTITQRVWKSYKTPSQSVTFAAKWMLKDLEYSKKFSQDEGSSLLDETLRKYQEAVARGYGEEDFMMINKL